jgi:hypothetical protein
MAIKGFLQGKSASAIISIVDLDLPTTDDSIIQKYLIVLMEEGLVVLMVKYDYSNEGNPPTISLIKHAPKLVADCTCANISPPERLEKPSFWTAKDNMI